MWAPHIAARRAPCGAGRQGLHHMAGAQQERRLLQAHELVERLGGDRAAAAAAGAHRGRRGRHLRHRPAQALAPRVLRRRCTARARIQRERAQAASPSSGRVMLRAVRAARRPHQARRRRRRAQQRQQGGWRRNRCGVQAKHAVMTDLRACRRVCVQHVAAGSQT